MSFRENLKAEIAYSGILVKELAAQAGLKKHTIDTYLSVRGRMPAADTAVRIARALGVTVEYLVTGEENSRDESSPEQEIRTLIRNFKSLPEDDRKMIIAILQLYKNRLNHRN